MVVRPNVQPHPCGPPVSEQDGGTGDFTGCIPEFRGGCVSEKDGSCGVDRTFVLEPFLANPQQFFLTLHVKGHSWVVAGVNQADVVEDQLSGERVQPHEIVEHGLLGEVQIALGLNDVGTVGRFATSLHPRLPRLKRPVALHALDGHVLVVSFDAHDAWVGAKKMDQPGGVGSTVDHVAEAHHAIVWFQLQPVQKGSEGRQVAVNIAHHKHSMSVVQSSLQVGLKRRVAQRRSEREVQLATQAVHRRGVPFGHRLFESLYLLPPVEGAEETVFAPFHAQGAWRESLAGFSGCFFFSGGRDVLHLVFR